MKVLRMMCTSDGELSSLYVGFIIVLLFVDELLKRWGLRLFLIRMMWIAHDLSDST